MTQFPRIGIVEYFEHSKLLYISVTVISYLCFLPLTIFYYAFVIPAFVQKFEVIGVVFICLGLAVWLITFSTFIKTMVMDPGAIPRALKAEKDHNIKGRKFKFGMSVPFRLKIINGVKTRTYLCPTCNIFRPPRSSHCSICDCCIEWDDHHCPWVYNCVGRRNYKYYLFLLLGTNLHLLFIIVLSSVFVFSDTRLMNTAEHIVCFIYIILCLMILCFTCSLSYFHIKLVSVRLTTKEAYKLSGTQYRNCTEDNDNPYDEGFCRNWYLTCCSPQYPSFLRYQSKAVERNSNEEATKDT